MHIATFATRMYAQCSGRRLPSSRFTFENQQRACSIAVTENMDLVDRSFLADAAQRRPKL
jgi:hypothetical protein